MKLANRTEERGLRRETCSNELQKGKGIRNLMLPKQFYSDRLAKTQEKTKSMESNKGGRENGPVRVK